MTIFQRFQLMLLERKISRGIKRQKIKREARSQAARKGWQTRRRVGA
jgi:hypothetical protein